METKVSVIMSTYNETEEELKRSIYSVLDQTYRDFEFVIVNDNPGNRMLKSFLNTIQDPRVIILENEVNLGLVKSLNRALAQATGNVIVRADADDICAANRIERQLKALEEKNLDLVGSYLDLINEDGSHRDYIKRFPLTHLRVRFFLRWGTCIPHPTWMGRRQVFDALNGYRETPYCEDYDFLVRAADKGFRMENIPEPLVQYRTRANGITGSHATKQYVLREYLAGKMRRIPTQEQIDEFLGSERFRKNCEMLDQYMADKISFRNGDRGKLVSVITNRYSWIRYLGKMMERLREL